MDLLQVIEILYKPVEWFFYAVILATSVVFVLRLLVKLIILPIINKL